VVETVLIVVVNVFHPPKSPFDFVFIVEQVLRISTFIILLSLYFGLRNDKKQYDNADAERQSLLRKKVASKQSSSEESVASANGYGGTTDSNTQESDTAAEASDAGSEDSWLADQRKAQEMIANRLKQDGNWFTYAKGFTVSWLAQTNSHSLMLTSIDILPTHLAISQQDTTIQSLPCGSVLARHKCFECSSSKSNGYND
jgi:hypothetical protein